MTPMVNESYHSAFGNAWESGTKPVCTRHGGTGLRPEMASGHIKWFSPAKGYGFITPVGGEEDIFLHYTGLIDPGKRDLKKGDMVEFDIVEGEKGPKALNVSKCEDAEKAK